MGESKRKMLTPEQRVAKLEAELAEAKAKAEAKTRARVEVLRKQRSTLYTQIGERKEKIEQINSELEALGFEAEAEQLTLDDVIDGTETAVAEDEAA